MVYSLSLCMSLSMFTSLVLPLALIEELQVLIASCQLVDISVTPSLYSTTAQSILIFYYLKIYNNLLCLLLY